MAIAAVAVFVLFIVVLPPIIARGDQTLTTAQRLKAENDVRATLLQALAGLIFLTGLYVTYRTFHLNREGQITHRFTEAITQLGHESIDVRLGGIYALEQIAKDSRSDSEAIFDVLAAFIREHARWRPNLSSTSEGDPSVESDDRPLAEDIQAALTVLGRRDHPGQYRAIDLSSSDLRGCRLVRLHFENATFSGTHLEHAVLHDTHLERAHLPDAHLEHAHLYETHLENAILPRANFDGAIIVDARFEGADCLSAHFEKVNVEPFSHPRWEGKPLALHHLCNSNFDNANLSFAHLKGAVLHGSSFQNADLEGADLEDADIQFANFEGANLYEAKLDRAEIVGARFGRADVRGVNLNLAKDVAAPE